jgi:hypothetical protein
LSCGNFFGSIRVPQADEIPHTAPSLPFRGFFLRCIVRRQGCAPDAAPSAEAIMARVAANQDQAEAERLRYVYVQHARMTSGKGRTVLCEELTDYRITPSSEGTHDELLKLDGRVRVRGKYISYHSLEKDENKSGVANDNDSVSIEIGGENADRDIVENMRKNLMHDQSKDGINAHLFPLTSKEQSTYAFQMVGRERLNGRDVVHITFRPKDKSEFGWMGDAYIDNTAYQPVLVTTGMARKVPFAVRTLLGTNLPGLGFTVVYSPQPDGVWFPVSFSSEFKIHVLYFFNRQIVLNAENLEFEKTHGTATILDGAMPVPP